MYSVILVYTMAYNPTPCQHPPPTLQPRSLFGSVIIVFIIRIAVVKHLVSKVADAP